MKNNLNDFTSEDLLSFKKGLTDMLTGYVTALEDINKEEKENVLYTFVKLNRQIDEALKL
ncbi:MAG: hypothetical protein KQH79_17470 [Bacteroidetes bacterium]|nr:hypothetical protein [Bacteroidota bacterium]